MAQTSSLNIRLIILQTFSLLLIPFWVLKFIHYFSHPLPFLFDSPSTIPFSIHEAQRSIDQIDPYKTIFNVLLFVIFFLQHYIMAALKVKITLHKLWSTYQLYERIFYNIISSILLFYVLQYQNPNTYVLFTLPQWLCMPLALIGGGLLIHSDMQMDKSIFLPYSFKELLSGEKIKIELEDEKKCLQQGITFKGAYGWVRHPMQSGTLLHLIFGSNIFTFEKVILVSFIGICQVIGVKLQEGRLLRKYKQYNLYMEKIKFRFIPYLF